MARLWQRGYPSAGLIAGPAAWGVSTQLNYALVPLVCGSTVPVIEVTPHCWY